MKPVIVESPYAADNTEDFIRNTRYLRACLKDCLDRDESPYASHAILTQPGVLRDNIPAEREKGINAGFSWKHTGALTVFYVDFGMTEGMYAALGYCDACGLPYEKRTIYNA